MEGTVDLRNAADLKYRPAIDMLKGLDITSDANKPKESEPERPVVGSADAAEEGVRTSEGQERDKEPERRSGSRRSRARPEVALQFFFIFQPMIFTTCECL
jgi:hypothetical protein